MKKIICAVLLCLLVLFTAVGCGDDNDKENTAEATEPETTTQAIDTQSKTITEENAKEAALKHAGFKEADVTFTAVSMDTDDNTQKYEVDFHTKDNKYDYEVDAVNGDVISADMEKLNQSAQESGKEISQDKAKSIVTEKIAGIKSEDVMLNLETDDGWKVYEGQVSKSNKHYEFEIDAITGDILSWSEDKGMDD